MMAGRRMKGQGSEFTPWNVVIWVTLLVAISVVVLSFVLGSQSLGTGVTDTALRSIKDFIAGFS